MKVTYSLKEFHEKAVAIAKINSDLVKVSVEYGIYRKFRFGCYADGYKFFEGETMEQCLALLEQAVNPAQRPNIDVEIDIEEEVRLDKLTPDEDEDEVMNLPEINVSGKDDLPF